jgi:hypothetical protein
LNKESVYHEEYHAMEGDPGTNVPRDRKKLVPEKTGKPVVRKKKE